MEFTHRGSVISIAGLLAAAIVAGCPSNPNATIPTASASPSIVPSAVGASDTPGGASTGSTATASTAPTSASVATRAKALFSVRSGGNLGSILLMDLEGKTVRGLIDITEVKDLVEAVSAKLSPAGNKAALLLRLKAPLAVKDESPSKIFIIDINGDVPLKLTKDFLLGEKRLTGSGLQWSTDGSKILFLSEKDGSVVSSPDGTNRTAIKFELGSLNHVWSPNGTITYKTAVTEYNIKTVSIDGKNIINLTNNKDRKIMSDAIWSPDGSKIAYRVSGFSDASPNPTNLFVMNSDGSDKTNLTNYNDSSTVLDIAWSPDSKKLVFLSTLTAKGTVYVSSLGNSKPIQLSMKGRPLAWSADGKKIYSVQRALEVSRPDNELYVSDADGNNETKISDIKELMSTAGIQSDFGVNMGFKIEWYFPKK